MPVTLINPFIVEPAQAAAFVENWKATAAVFADAPGYLDTQLYEAIDPAARYGFINVAHWASAESWADAMKAHPPREKGEAGVTASPALYRPAAGGAVPARTDAIGEELRGIEQGIGRAFLAADAEFFDRLLAEDYSVVDGPGTVSAKPKVLADLREGRLRVAEFTFEEIAVRPLGPEAAIVTGAYRWTATYDGRTIPGHFRYLRVYARDPAGRWRVRAGQVTPIQPPRS